MDPFVLGSALSAGASLLGGVLDRKDQRSATGRDMTQKIEVGKKYGLHPSVSIGAQSGSYYPVMAGALGEAGQSVQQGLVAKAEAKARESAQNQENALIAAQIEEARSRTLLNTVNAKRAMEKPDVQDPFAMRKENALMAVKLENGDIVWVPNPDVYEISPTEAATMRAIIEAARLGQVTLPEAQERIDQLYKTDGASPPTPRRPSHPKRGRK